MSTRADKKRDAHFVIPDDVYYISDISYAGKCTDIRESEGIRVSDIKFMEKYPDTFFQNMHALDISYPKSLKEGEKLPVIISIHGGGYVYGSKEVYKYYCADLAKRGFLVVNFNYRLAPFYRFPAPLEDVVRVLEWLCINKDNYPMDTDNCFLLGDSAGATLACQYAAIYTNKEYRDLFGFDLPDMKIRALGLNCGLFDLKSAVDRFGKSGTFKDYLGSDPDLKDERLNVLKYIDKEYLPTYLFSSNGDFFKGNVEPMADLLMKNNIPVSNKIYGDKKTYHVFHVNVVSDVGREANDDEIEFFRKYLDK